MKIIGVCRSMRVCRMWMSIRRVFALGFESLSSACTMPVVFTLFLGRCVSGLFISCNENGTSLPDLTILFSLSCRTTPLCLFHSNLHTYLPSHRYPYDTIHVHIHTRISTSFSSYLYKSSLSPSSTRCIPSLYTFVAFLLLVTTVLYDPVYF